MSRLRRLDSLRNRLLVAIGLVVVLSVGLTLAIGALLTRREVERATLRDLSHQADLLAARELAAIFPHPEALRPVLRRQGEQIHTVPLNRPSQYLPSGASDLRAGRGVEGTLTLGGTSFYYAARRIPGRQALVLIRPTRLSAVNSKPYVNGLIVAAVAGFLLAAIVSFLLARAITRPARRVAEASRSLAAQRSPELVPVEGPRELASLAASFNDMAAQLERAKAAERSFLLSVSHELKTPLTAIRGYAEGLAEGAVPEDEAAETIGKEAQRLERLVRDLLEIARMNRSEFSIHCEPIDLAQVVEETVQRYEQQARGFEITLEGIAPAQAPALGDHERLLQVTSNLVENALRSTPPGGVVRVAARPLELVVEDSGPGLEPDDLPRAFERFYLYSRYTGERMVGTGLGLSIVKQLTEGMGGTVTVTSDPGRLTRFTVRLPAAPADSRRPAEERTLIQA